jgi:hypothetical protein
MHCRVGCKSGIVQPSWMTASQHSVVVHYHYERARPANRGQPLKKIMAAIWLFRASHASSLYASGTEEEHTLV